MAITLPHDAMAQLFEAAPANDLPPVPNYNVCPTNAVAVVTSDGGRRAWRPMRWGFVPAWYKAPNDGPLLINARSETVAEKPAFRAAIRARRCLVVATGFFEWDRTDPKKPLPWFVRRADGAPMVMAGLWQDWEAGGERLTGMAMLTCAANAVMAPVHDRLPVIVERADWGLWLGEAGHGAAPLMRPAAEDVLAMHRVGVEVNSNRARGPGLILPTADAGADRHPAEGVPDPAADLG